MPVCVVTRPLSPALALRSPLNDPAIMLQGGAVIREEEEPRRPPPRNRTSAFSKVRHSPKHCPVCLAPLEKIARRTRLAKFCAACQSHPSLGKRCRKCLAESVWENKREEACRTCGQSRAET